MPVCKECGNPELDEDLLEIWGLCASCIDYMYEAEFPEDSEGASK